MTLEYQIDSLDGLDENTSSLYVEKDGKFVLDVAGHDKTDSKQNSQMPPGSRNSQTQGSRETGLQTVADGLKEDIPEEFRDLIPEPAAREAYFLDPKNKFQRHIRHQRTGTD